MSEDQKSKNLFYTTGLNGEFKHTLPDHCFVKQRSTAYEHSLAATVNDRSGFNRYDYYEKRPAEKIPTTHSDIILACQAVYRKVGIVRNVVDLMTDFASEGLELKHSIKSHERFYRKWAEKVNLQGRVHDFIKLLLRDANVIVRRKNALISRPIIKDMSKGYVGTFKRYNLIEQPERIKRNKKNFRKLEIPWKYTFIAPSTVVKLGGSIGKFWGDNTVGIVIPTLLANAITAPKDEIEKELINKLPPEIIKAALDSTRTVALNMDRIYIEYYKKDDWEDWGTPFLYAILEDVLLRDKMRLADMATLDGVINVIRLWKLGNSKNPEYAVLPTSASVEKLINILQYNTGGGTMDLVWNDMIELQTEYPPTDKILGADKYKSVNSDIMRGLGIPESLVGSDSGARNSQSVFVQLKTLVERLEYVRNCAIKWLKTELRLLADAVGFKNIPSISFGVMSLRDESSEKQLMVQLLDRGIISAEKIHEAFGSDFMIELERLRDEQTIRNNNNGVLERAGPYYRPNSVMEKQSELQIKLEETKVGLSGGDNLGGDQPTDEGDNEVGRPPNTPDGTPRDDRTPTTLSVLQLFNSINERIIPKYLKQVNVSSFDELTQSQLNDFRNIQMAIVASVGSDYDIDRIQIDSKKFDNFKKILNNKYLGYNVVDQDVFTSMLGTIFVTINKRDV